LRHGAGYPGGDGMIGGAGKAESSFSEEKEAKRLLSISPSGCNHLSLIDRSSLVLSFKKEQFFVIL
jgi:hypothetical protein